MVLFVQSIIFHQTAKLKRGTKKTRPADANLVHTMQEDLTIFSVIQPLLHQSQPGFPLRGYHIQP
jgi:hypothetical protein